jgi:hypothetical protein
MSSELDPRSAGAGGSEHSHNPNTLSKAEARTALGTALARQHGCYTKRLSLNQLIDLALQMGLDPVPLDEWGPAPRVAAAAPARSREGQS